MCLSQLRQTLASLRRHGRFGANRDRGGYLPSGDSSAALPATCNCDGANILTAPPTPKLIPKGRYGTSVWVEILLDKYFSYRPTERLLASWRLLDLDLAPGTVTDGLQRLEVLLRPVYEALKERNPHGDLHQGDETRWRVFVI